MGGDDGLNIVDVIFIIIGFGMILLNWVAAIYWIYKCFATEDFAGTRKIIMIVAAVVLLVPGPISWIGAIMVVVAYFVLKNE